VRDYDAAGTAVYITSTNANAGWEDFFANANNAASPNGCAVTKCELFKAGACGTTSLATHISSKFVVLTSDSWKIQIIPNYENGFTQSICVRCSNDGNAGSTFIGHQDYDKWEIHQKRDCSKVFADASPQPTTETVIEYNATPKSVGFSLFSTCTNPLDDPRAASATCTSSTLPNIFKFTD
jgi:hypothetical protein